MSNPKLDFGKDITRQHGGESGWEAAQAISGGTSSTVAREESTETEQS